MIRSFNDPLYPTKVNAGITRRSVNARIAARHSVLTRTVVYRDESRRHSAILRPSWACNKLARHENCCGKSCRAVYTQERGRVDD